MQYMGGVREKPGRERTQESVKQEQVTGAETRKNGNMRFCPSVSCRSMYDVVSELSPAL